MLAVRHYWNSSLPLISSPIERELIKEPLKIMLQCLASTAVKMNKEMERQEKEAKTQGGTTGTGHTIEPTTEENLGIDPSKASQSQLVGSGVAGSGGDDLTLRAALYGVLFQSYADQGEYEEGLSAMDEAVNSMPRTKHRLLIYKHRVIVKAKLGRTVHMDIQKFKDESEDYVSHMWRKVALCSKEELDQLCCYQNSIEALSGVNTNWQKFDYLIEMGQWLYVNEFPLQDACDQLAWAADILLNMKFETVAKKEGKGKQKGKGRKPSSKGPPKGKKPAIEGRKSPEKNEQSDGEGSDTNIADYIPVEKRIMIGLLPSNMSLTVKELCDIQQLDGLFRVHVLHAQVAGRKSLQFVDHCLMAHAFVMRIWESSLSASGPVIKDMSRSGALDKLVDKGSANKNKAKKPENNAPPKEKPKRKGPPESLPSSQDEWAQYDVPDEVIEACKQEAMKGAGINNKTIPKPGLTYYYMDLLADYLRDIGFNHLALPILAMMDMLTRDLLKSRALNALVHLKSVEVCLELNMATAALFHENLVGSLNINEEELAKSREEMSILKERHLQVAKEEERVKRNLDQGDELPKTDLERLKLARLKREAASQEEKDRRKAEKTEAEHLGTPLGGVKIKDVWTDTAQVLIKQGIYQPAREMLNEAHSNALCFDDKQGVSKILYLFGLLSYHEAQYVQAVNFCHEAQVTHEGDEMFWFNTTWLMIDATAADHTNRERFREARKMLVHSLNVFSEVTDERPNKESITGYILARLEARLGSIQAKISMETYSAITKPKVTEALLSACKKMANGANKLLDLGYPRESVAIRKEHGLILWKLAQAYDDTENVHSFFLQAMHIFTRAVGIAEDIAENVQTLIPLHELRLVNLPVQRELADIKITMAECMINILEVFIDEERAKKIREMRKGSVEKILEDMICHSPELTQDDKEWIHLTKCIGERTLADLRCVHTLSGGIVKLKCRAQYNIGKCMRLLAVHKNPDAPSLWDLNEMNILRMEEALMADGEEETQPEEEVDKTTKQYHKYSTSMKKAKKQLFESHRYFVEASEILVQALNLCLQHQHRDVAGLVALELAECGGQFDPATTSMYLALYQSCQASLYMEGLLEKAQQDPTSSQLAALLHQRRMLLENDVTTNLTTSSTMSTINRKLETDWEAWRRLTVVSNHLDIIREFPPDFNLVVLQHSPDNKYLYGAILDKPKTVPAAPEISKKPDKKSQIPPLHTTTKAQVVRVKVNPKMLEKLVEKFKTHKHTVMLLLLKAEYQKTAIAQRKKMLANLDDNSRTKSETPEENSELDEDIASMEEEFEKLMEVMENYVKPITQQFHSAFRPPTVLSQNTGTDKKDKKEPQPPDPLAEPVVLLADQYLLEMPLEALSAFQIETVVSMTRDFSMQMLHHRFYEDPQDEGAKKPVVKDDKNKPPSRIPGLRDASKKQAKFIPLDRPVPTSCVPVDTNNFRYMVDVLSDCAETEEHKPQDIFNALVNRYSQQFTTRWIGIAGEEHVPSVGEWELYLAESSSLIFYGMERFMNYIPPSKLLTLNLPECKMVFLYDLANTSKSFLTQSKRDVKKSASVLALEKPVETAAMISLTGVKSIFTNQWHCALNDNGQKLVDTMKDLLERGNTSGETARNLFVPYRRTLDEDDEEETVPDDNNNKADDEISGSENGGQEVKIAEPDPVPERGWYNMVCYGLPNLIVVQV